MELEEDPEKIQWEVDAHIAMLRAHNKKRQLEWKDWQWKEEEEWRKQEEEQEQKWKEEVDWKKEKADNDTYEEKLAEAHQMQLKVHQEVFVLCGEWFPDFEETEGKMQSALGSGWWGKKILLLWNSRT